MEYLELYNVAGWVMKLIVLERYRSNDRLSIKEKIYFSNEGLWLGTSIFTLSFQLVKEPIPFMYMEYHGEVKTRKNIEYFLV